MIENQMTENRPRPPYLRPGFLIGLALFIFMRLLPVPAAMSDAGWTIAALTLLMAVWWMSEAVPLTVTAFLPFLIVPLTGAMDAPKIAAAYYSPILFLILGGAFLALAIEKSGLHRRLALAIVARSGGSAAGLLAAFMLATALISMVISNTSTALIMMPIALALLNAGGANTNVRGGFPGGGFPAALVLGIAFAATIGGFGTLVGSPTNAIAAGLVAELAHRPIGFLEWSAYGVPLVLLSLPILLLILLRTQKVDAASFDVAAAHASIAAQSDPRWSAAEKRLVPVLLLVVAGWLSQPWVEPLLPKGSLTDGSIAIAGAMLLFLIPSGDTDGTPLLTWAEANRAPWGIIMMFGGGLALAAAMGASGLAGWLGTALGPLRALPLPLVAVLVIAMVIAFTEFASNVAAASGIIPVVTALALGLGVDPMLLVMPAALAASWGFILPAGTGPNAIAWATGYVRMPDMVRAGVLLDLAGVPLMLGVVWGVHSLLR